MNDYIIGMVQIITPTLVSLVGLWFGYLKIVAKYKNEAKLAEEKDLVNLRKYQQEFRGELRVEVDRLNERLATCREEHEKEREKRMDLEEKVLDYNINIKSLESKVDNLLFIIKNMEGKGEE